MIDDDCAVADGSEPAAPANPRTPYSERPVARARRAKAHELIERLVAGGRVRITDPDDDEVAEWRRVVNYAKRHGLEPAGKRIEVQVADEARTYPSRPYRRSLGILGAGLVCDVLTKRRCDVRGVGCSGLSSF
ncbi:hypothetical protein ABZT02_04895 [Streptomyces sp. NPDC005402]|uniref:hypothetical protein n=1 Tax=Streptomyces sp. NPDC005402 TaxID=3155338 RepID=UPI0033A5090F